MKEQPIYIITVTPTPDPDLKRTPEMRLRAALKALLRGYSLRCLSVTEQQPTRKEL